jgi:hypothetical protein
MRSRIRSTSALPVRAALLALLALLLWALCAVPASAGPFDGWFSDEYRKDTQPWSALVPPPPLDELPERSYLGSDTCQVPTARMPAPEARRRYCGLSYRCTLGPAGTLKDWCVVLGEVINDSFSLTTCQGRSDRDTQPQCLQNRGRLAAKCRSPPAPGLTHLTYLCASLRTVYPPGSGPDPPPPADPAPPAPPADPAPPAPPAPDPGGGDDEAGDLVGFDSAVSWWCPRATDPEIKARCDRSDSIARDYPLSSYGIDSFFDAGVFDLHNVLPAAIHMVVRIVWFIALLAVNGVLLLQEWAFSIDLVGRALSGLTAALGQLHNTLLGESWLLLGISVTALWGIWSGFVRSRRIETLAGMGATVAMICASLVIITNPVGTVGEWSGMANEASVSALSMVTGHVQNPDVAYPEAQRRLFNMMVMPSWCMLQFGSGDYCLSKPGRICTKNVRDNLPDGDLECSDFAGTVADAWLVHPAGSTERAKLFWGLKGTDEPRVVPQTASGAIARPGVLLIVLFTTVGEILLLLHLSLRLITAAVMTLALLLALPVMLIVPAFGDAGRRAMVSYAKAGGGAIFAKFLYALGTAGVFVIADLIAGLRLGPFATQMLLGVFFWGVWLRRNTIFGFLMPAAGAPSLASMYYGAQMLRGAARGAVRTATAPLRGAWRGGKGTWRAGRWTADRVGQHRGARRDARREAVRRSAASSLEQGAVDAVRTKNADDMQRARGVLAAEPQNRQQRDASRDGLKEIDDKLSTARPARDALQARRDAMSPGATRDKVDDRLAKADSAISTLEARRGAHQDSLQAAEAGLADVDWARSTVRRAPAGGEIPVRESDVRDHIAARRRLLARQGPGKDRPADMWERTLHARSGDGKLSRSDRWMLKTELRGRKRKPLRKAIRRDAKRIRKDVNRRPRGRGRL